MSWHRESELVAAMTAADLGWWIGTDTEERVAEVLREAGRVSRELERSLPVQRSALGPSWSLADQMIDQRDALKPFIQTMAQPMTTSMRTMVLAVVLGASVVSFMVEYRRQATARLSITVDVETGEEATFESDDLWDFEVLRHFGLMKMGQRPVIDGYYSFRKESA